MTIKISKKSSNKDKELKDYDATKEDKVHVENEIDDADSKTIGTDTIEEEQSTKEKAEVSSEADKEIKEEASTDVKNDSNEEKELKPEKFADYQENIY